MYPERLTVRFLDFEGTDEFFFSLSFKNEKNCRLFLSHKIVSNGKLYISFYEARVTLLSKL